MYVQTFGIVVMRPVTVTHDLMELYWIYKELGLAILILHVAEIVDFKSLNRLRIVHQFQIKRTSNILFLCVYLDLGWSQQRASHYQMGYVAQVSLTCCIETEIF